jgi:hypothetical protein
MEGITMKCPECQFENPANPVKINKISYFGVDRRWNI